MRLTAAATVTLTRCALRDYAAGDAVITVKGADADSEHVQLRLLDVVFAGVSIPYVVTGAHALVAVVSPGLDAAGFAGAAVATCDAAAAVCLAPHCEEGPAVGVACACASAAGDVVDATACARAPQMVADVPASLEFAFVLTKPARQTAEAVVRNPSQEPSAVLEYSLALAAEVAGFLNVSKAGGVDFNGMVHTEQPWYKQSQWSLWYQRLF